MTIYSASLFHGYIPTGFTAIYTPPVGKTSVVRDIEIYNGDTGPHTVNFQVGSSGTTAILWNQVQVPNSTWEQWSGRVVIPAGGSLWGYGGGSSLIQAVISGYELTEP